MKKILFIIFYFIYITNGICEEQKPLVINYKNYYGYNNFSEFLDKEYHITEQDKKSITWIELQGLNFSNSLPFTVIDFPNLEKLDITNFFVLYDLKGIETFLKLKSLKIESNHELPLDRVEFLNYDLYWPIDSEDEFKKVNFSRIWQISTLQELIINRIPHLVLLPNTLSKLQNLKSLNIQACQFLYNEIIQLPKLKNLTVSTTREYLEDFMTFFLLKKYCKKNHCKIFFSENNKQIFPSDIYDSLSKSKIPQEGICEMYYKSGRKAVIGFFKNGYQDGFWTYLSDNEENDENHYAYEKKYNYFEHNTNSALNNKMLYVNNNYKNYRIILNYLNFLRFIKHKNYKIFNFYVKNFIKNDTIMYYNTKMKFEWNDSARSETMDNLYIYYPSLNKAISYSYIDTINYVVILYDFLKFQQIIFNRNANEIYSVKIITLGGEYAYTCKEYNTWTKKYEKINDTVYYSNNLEIFSKKNTNVETQNSYLELTKEMYKNMNKIMDSNLNIIKKEFEFLDTIQLNKPKVRF